MTYDEFALRFTEFYNECKHFDPRELRERVYKNRLIAHYRLLRKHDVQDYDRVIAGYLQVDIKPEWPWPGIMLELVCGERDSREADERTKCREPPQGELCSREEIEEIERRLRTLQGWSGASNRSPLAEDVVARPAKKISSICEDCSADRLENGSRGAAASLGKSGRVMTRRVARTIGYTGPGACTYAPPQRAARGRAKVVEWRRGSAPR